MQMKPSSAREPDIAIEGIEKSAERNIEAGNKYLRFLITKYINDPNSTTRTGRCLRLPPITPDQPDSRGSEIRRRRWDLIAMCGSAM